MVYNPADEFAVAESDAQLHVVLHRGSRPVRAGEEHGFVVDHEALDVHASINPPFKGSAVAYRPHKNLGLLNDDWAKMKYLLAPRFLTKHVKVFENDSNANASANGCLQGRAQRFDFAN